MQCLVFYYGYFPVSDPVFVHRIQNCLRDYIRYLVALGNYSFVEADESAYVRILYELLMRGDRNAGNPDANLSRLLRLRSCILPRIAAFLRDQGRFPNLDELPSRLLAWSSRDDHVMHVDSSSGEHPSRADCDELDEVCG
ncbi:unnamed protein product [Cylicostephanus goldi]|uniref:Uncharacterized protein n=1 Tax=Cylicostephanus goldi TaxID=71465 RepID=A0A3P6RT40_CYLGO|nr:unnamed protein product [Cylicostephanus goldi]